MAWYKLFSSGKSGVDAACGHIKTCKNVSSSSKIQYANLGNEFTTYLTGIKTAVEAVEGSTVEWTDLAAKIASFTLASSEEDPTPVLTSITATKTNVTYPQNGTVDTSDIVVTAHYDDNTTADVTSSSTFSAVDTSTAGTKILTVSYGGKNFNIQLTITASITLQSIAATKTTSTYTFGDDISTNDIAVTATYSNGSTEDVTSSATYGSVDSMSLGSKSLTVSYQNKTYDVPITINSPIFNLPSDAGTDDYPSIVVLHGKTANVNTNKYWCIGGNAGIGAPWINAGAWKIACASGTSRSWKVWYSDDGGVTWTLAKTSSGVATFSSNNTNHMGSETVGSSASEVYWNNATEDALPQPTGQMDSTVVSKTNTTYQVGEQFSTDDVELHVKFTNNTIKKFTNGLTISAVDTSTAGTKSMTCSKGSLSSTINITVEDLYLYAHWQDTNVLPDSRTVGLTTAVSALSPIDTTATYSVPQADGTTYAMTWRRGVDDDGVPLKTIAINKSIAQWKTSNGTILFENIDFTNPTTGELHKFQIMNGGTNFDEDRTAQGLMTTIVFRNCLFYDFEQNYARQTFKLKFEHCKFANVQNPNPCEMIDCEITRDGYSSELNASNASDAMNLGSDATINGLWIHDIDREASAAGSSHQDGIQVGGNGATTTNVHINRLRDDFIAYDFTYHVGALNVPLFFEGTLTDSSVSNSEVSGGIHYTITGSKDVVYTNVISGRSKEGNSPSAWAANTHLTNCTYDQLPFITSVWRDSDNVIHFLASNTCSAAKTIRLYVGRTGGAIEYKDLTIAGTSTTPASWSDVSADIEYSFGVGNWLYAKCGDTHIRFANFTNTQVLKDMSSATESSTAPTNLSEPEEEPIALEPTLDSISAHLVGNVNNNVVYGSSGPDYSKIRVTLHYVEEDEPDAVIDTGFTHTNLNTNVVGAQNITITYNNKTCTLAYNVYAVPSSFVFNPTKTAFYLNETVGDCYGTATVTMNDGTTQTWINNNGIQYTGWVDTSSLKDDGFVEVALIGYSSIPVQSFTYTVSEPWTTGVSIDKVRRGYSVNDVVDTFDVSVTKHLCNGTTATADASEYTITADTTTESGVKELSVTCEGYEDEVEFGVTEAKTNGVKSSTYGTDRYEYGAEIIWADDRPNAYNAFCIQYNDKNHSTRTVTPLSEMIESGTVIVGDPKVESTSVTGCSKVTRNFYWRGQCFTHVGYQYAFNQATDDVYIEFPNGNVIDMSDTDSLLMEDFLKKVTGTNDVYYMDSTTDGYLDSATVDSSTVLPADYPIRAYTIKNGMKIDVTFHMFDKGSLFSAYDFLEQMYSKVFNDLCNNVVSENNNDDMTPVKITLNWNDTYYGETYLTNDCEDAYRVTSTISSGMTSYNAALPIRYHFTFTIKPTQADYPEQFYTPVTVTDDSYGNGYSFSKFNPSQCYMVNVTDTSDSVHKLMVINYNTDCHTDTSDDDEIITYDEVSDTDAGGRTYILSSDDGFHTYEVVHEWYSSNDDTTPTTFNVSTWATTNGFAVASVSIDSDQNAREYLESDSRPAFNRFAFRLPEIVKNSAHGAYHTYTCTANSHTYRYLVFLRPKTGNSISLTVEEGSLPGYIQPKYIPNVDSWIYIFCSVDGGWTWRRMYKLNVPEEYSVTGGTGVQLTAVFNETGNVTAYVKISSSGVGSTVYTWSTDNVTTF